MMMYSYLLATSPAVTEIASRSSSSSSGGGATGFSKAVDVSS
jgi:hypothetical protein